MIRQANQSTCEFEINDNELNDAFVLDCRANLALGEDFSCQLTLVTDKLTDSKSHLNKVIRISILSHQIIEHGIITKITQANLDQRKKLILTIHSPLYWLKQSSHCRRFIEKSAKEILAECLKAHNIKAVFQIKNRLKILKIITQHEQTDYDFILTLMSEQGLWFYFKGVSLIITDRFIETENTHLAFKTNKGLHTETLYAFDLKQNHQLPLQKIRVYGVTTQNSLHNIKAQDLYSENSSGYHTFFKADATTKEECLKKCGDIRGQLSNQPILTVLKCNHPAIRLGQMITLTKHPNPSCNQRYRVIAMHQAVNQTAAILDENSNSRTYVNTLCLIPIDKPFTISIKNRQHFSLKTGFVSSHKPPKPELNHQGHYRIRMPYETSAPKTALCQKLSLLTGKNSGMHFPLHHNSEVLLAYINGDINRPVILGALSNKHSQNCVTEHNKTVHLMKTQTGHALSLNDGQEKSITLQHASKHQTLKLSSQPNALSLRNDDGDVSLVCEKTLNHLCKQDYKHQTGKSTTLMVQQHYLIQSICGNIDIDCHKQDFSSRSNKILQFNASNDITLKANDLLTIQCDQTLTATAKDTLSLESDSILTIDCEQLTATESTQTTLICGNSSIMFDNKRNMTINTAELIIYSDQCNLKSQIFKKT